MAIIKCKMCGGDLEIAAGVTVAECEYCGTKQTLPKVNDEVVQNLFNRANNLRIKCEFDKAEQIYEKILQENDAEAEAHWGIVLCKYGIEYVEDPKTFKRIPTCHRTSYDAVTADTDYLAAVEHADAAQKEIYEAEAKAIDKIQKDILNIVKNEKPFDVFICYKETDESGKRTIDSSIANDIYYQLTQEGMKVFYAAITLEDKLGQEYEPYIFAALNSAKVMLVIGTKPQYFSAVWVKNEWSRFLKLMKADRSKLLIPCYKEMDAYDLPEEFAHLQAQDMAKIGFINDIVRGIKKVTKKEEPKPVVVKETVTGNTTVAPLLKRIFIFLEDREWDSADEYCEKVLDIDPENAMAYLGKLMASLKVRKQEYLKHCAEPFDNNNNYKKVMRYADDDLKTTLSGYIDFINDRNETTRLEGIYTRATRDMSAAKTDVEFDRAAELFESISQYKDAATLAAQCRQNAKEYIYTRATNAMASAGRESAYKNAAEIFETIPQYKDAATLAVRCREKAEECREKAELERLENLYSTAASIMEKAQSDRDYEKAENLFKSISHFKDAQAQAQICLEKATDFRNEKVYSQAMLQMDGNTLILSRSYTLKSALEKLQSIAGWKDADEKIALCRQMIEEALAQEEAERIEQERKLQETIAKVKKIAMIVTPIVVALVIGLIVLVNVILPNINYNKAVAMLEAGQYQEAVGIFEKLGDYKDSENYLIDCHYQKALDLKKAGDKIQAALLFSSLGDYRDSQTQATALWKEAAVWNTIAAGEDHTVCLKNDGTVVAIGEDANNRCKVDEWKDIVAVAAGNAHTVGLKSDGTVVAAGGFGNDACDVNEWKDIVSIATGGNCTVGLKSDGTVVVAGNINYSFGEWKDIVAVAAGQYHVVGLKSDGTVIAVGSNVEGQTNVADWTDIVAIAAGKEYTVGLKSNGTVVAVGYNGDKQCDVSTWKDIVAIAAGESHTIGLKADGTVVAVGDKGFDKCEVSGWTGIVAVAVGKSHTLGLKSDGTMVAVGSNYDGQCNVTKWTSLAAGGRHTVGLLSDGTVVAFGSNADDQCEVDEWADIVAVAAGNNFTLGLKADSTVVATGKCDVTGWLDIVGITAGYSHALGLKSNGTVVATGTNAAGQCEVTGWTDIISVAAGYSHTVGLKSDGTVVAVGSNYYKQTEVAGWTDIVAIAAGNYHTVGLKSDGTVVAVGASDDKQCWVQEWTDISAITAGGAHTVGLKTDGTVVIAGGGLSNSNAADWTGVVTVAAGDVHTVGLKSDGSVVATGQNSYKQCDVTGGVVGVKLPKGVGK